jgi:hypothetical protein
LEPLDDPLGLLAEITVVLELLIPEIDELGLPAVRDLARNAEEPEAH